MNYLNEHNIFLFLIQMFLLLTLARGAGDVFRHWRQSPLAAEILVGIVLGPTILGRFFPAFQSMIFPQDPAQWHMLETVSWLGVFFLLLESGLDINIISAWRQRGRTLTIAISGILIPMTLIFVFCLCLPDHYLVDPSRKVIFSLFMATIMSITAITVVSRILQDLNLNKTDLGSLIMTALSVNDILGWVIFTLIMVFFLTGQFVISKVSIVLVLILTFIFFCLTGGRLLTEKILAKIKARQMPEPSTSLSFICLLGIFCGAVTQGIGIHALLGFLLAGIMAGGTKTLSERTRHIISQMVFAIFVPIFFASIGLRTDFFSNFDFKLVFFICVLSIVGKFVGAYVGTWLAKLSQSERMPVAIAHIPGGMMEVVVGMIAFENHLITEKMFVAIIFSAIASSFFVGPWLSYCLKRRKEFSVLEFFSRRAIIAEMVSITKEDAIDELCELVSVQYSVPSKEYLVKAVLERENILGTSLGQGVAVPHARFSWIKSPIIVFGRSRAGIDWDAPDGKLTHFVFLILTLDKDTDVQVQVLRAIAATFSQVDVQNQCLKIRDEQGLWESLQNALTEQKIQRK